MKIAFSPKLASWFSTVTMIAILAGIALLTLSTLQNNRSDMGEVRRSIEIGNLYSQMANEVSSLTLANTEFVVSQDPQALLQLQTSGLRILSLLDRIAEVGDDEDRAFIAEQRLRYQKDLADLQTTISNAIKGGPVELRTNTNTAQAVEALKIVTDRAEQKRTEALAMQQASQDSLRTRSLAAFVAFGLGVPLVLASFLVTSHYERKAGARNAEMRQLERAAITDGLTGLANHRAFQEDLKQAVALANRSKQPVSIAMIDIDGFKEVNDIGGHAQGDKVLAELAKLMADVRGQDRAYRVGGDEFALIMQNTGTDGALDALERMRQSVTRSTEGVTISLGLATSEADHTKPEALRDDADAALYAAKHRGKNQIVVYSPELDHGGELTAVKMRAIKRVLASREISMWFQPILELNSHKVFGFEALLRLPTAPELSGPEEAFGIAQRMGRSRDLDLMCIGTALDAAGELPAGSRIFINVDPGTLIHSSFSADEFLELATTRRVDPGRVVFEVTEKTSVPLSRLAKQVGALRERGFATALDDVGAGNFGLEMMRLMKFDFVKIDRSVIVDAVDSGLSRAVIIAIVAFARETGSFIIAEGLENPAMLAGIQLDEEGLKRFWVQGGQGFMFGEPRSSIGKFLDEATREVA
jgi:diguanylate cyclase (GGDEF)-like protein